MQKNILPEENVVLKPMHDFLSTWMRSLGEWPEKMSCNYAEGLSPYENKVGIWILRTNIEIMQLLPLVTACNLRLEIMQYIS